MDRYFPSDATLERLFAHDLGSFLNVFYTWFIQ